LQAVATQVFPAQPVVATPAPLGQVVHAVPQFVVPLVQVMEHWPPWHWA
jgi:hypothetical protein